MRILRVLFLNVLVLFCTVNVFGNSITGMVNAAKSFKPERLNVALESAQSFLRAAGAQFDANTAKEKLKTVNPATILKILPAMAHLKTIWVRDANTSEAALNSACDALISSAQSFNSSDAELQKIVKVIFHVSVLERKLFAYGSPQAGDMKAVIKAITDSASTLFVTAGMPAMMTIPVQTAFKAVLKSKQSTSVDFINGIKDPTSGSIVKGIASKISGR